MRRGVTGTGGKCELMPPMTPERWQRVTALLDEVLPCDPSQREERLEILCEGDEELRREVESLLRYEAESVSVLEEPLAPWRPSAKETWPGGETPPETDEVGLRIGPYRVLQRLGAGGMGTVYLAAREDDFRKRVALKRIKRQVLSEEVLYRFENERQILADLEHPNIARILDAGKTQDQLPYFAMEYVDGRAIDTYCNRQRLTVRQRIELVLEVCSALQLAHQNLVVHRDLKPGNILVTRDGVPKLIDFGIAKHLEPASVPHDLATQAGTRPMTLRYASPEQFSRLPITTASDIYSLGVLIYQLLTGHDPYPFDQGLVAMHRSICEHDPMKPSAAVARSVEVQVSKTCVETRTPQVVSWDRSTSPEKLKSALAGDLDGILLKALRKKPENRYRSVEQLADDLRLHLQGLPVSACEGTFHYLTGKFVRRHTVPLIAAGVVLLLVVGSALAIITLRRQAADKEARSEQVRVRAALTGEVLDNVIGAFDPEEAGNRVTPLVFLNRTRQRIREDLESDPELLADLLLGPLCSSYNKLGYSEEALASLEEALDILRPLRSGDDPKIAEILVNQGAVFFLTGDYEKAEERSRDGLEMRQRLGMRDADLVGPLQNLASNLFQQGELDEAAQLYQEAVMILERDLGPGSRQSARPLRSLGMVEFLHGRVAQARTMLDQSLAIELEHRGPDSLRVAALRSTLGRVLHAEGRYEDADLELLQALRIRRSKLDADHIEIARAERNLAAVMIELGDLATAKVLLDHAQQAFRRANVGRERPDEDWELAESESLLGALLAAQGHYQEAETCLIESYHAIAAARGPELIYAQQALRRVNLLYELWGKPARAAEEMTVLKVGTE